MSVRYLLPRDEMQAARHGSADPNYRFFHATKAQKLGENVHNQQGQKATGNHHAEVNKQSSTCTHPLLPDHRHIPFSNLLAGGVVGLCSIVVGQPLETVKVKLQTME